MSGYTAELRAAVPEPVLEALDRWVEHGLWPGGFVTSVLENDFAGAVMRADHVNRHHLRAIAEYVINELPSACWGHPEKLERWAARFQPEEEGDERDADDWENHSE